MVIFNHVSVTFDKDEIGGDEGYSRIGRRTRADKQWGISISPSLPNATLSISRRFRIGPTFAAPSRWTMCSLHLISQLYKKRNSSSARLTLSFRYSESEPD